MRLISGLKFNRAHVHVDESKKLVAVGGVPLRVVLDATLAATK